MSKEEDAAQLEDHLLSILEKKDRASERLLAAMDDLSNSVRSYNTSQLVVGIGLAALIVACAIWFPMYR
jgi:predicted PurR-regulated permease PerM